MGLADNIARKASPSEKVSIENAAKKTVANPKTVLDFINQANTFTPGTPPALVQPAYMKPGPPLPTTTTSTPAPTTPAPVAPAPVAPAPAPVAASPVVSKPAPTPPTLNLPDPPQYTGIKSAPIDTIEFIDETFSDNLIIDLLFEDVGGQELLTIARNDTVNGQSVVYQPFKNLGILQETYNATTLLRLQETSDKFFSNFLINLRSKIPNVGNGENGKNYYLDLTNGSGIIEFVNIRSDEQVEIQIASAGIIEETGI
jgi:hypothetical protein